MNHKLIETILGWQFLLAGIIATNFNSHSYIALFIISVVFFVIPFITD